jgi:hypothetical protein
MDANLAIFMKGKTNPVNAFFHVCPSLQKLTGS